MLADLSDPLPAALGMWDPINKPGKKVIFHTAWIYKLYQHYSGLCSEINVAILGHKIVSVYSCTSWQT